MFVVTKVQVDVNTVKRFCVESVEADKAKSYFLAGTYKNVTTSCRTEILSASWPILLLVNMQSVCRFKYLN